MTKIIELLRREVFWALDKLRGGKIKWYYDDIKTIMESFNSEESQKKRKDHLENLLEHATANCDFYKDFSHCRTLSQFPIVNKTIIRNNFESIKSKFYKNQINHEMSTSGSSGTPFKTLQNTNKKLRNTADTIYFKQKAGFEIGFRLYYIRKWFKMHKRSWITTITRNIIMVNVTEFNEDYLARLIDKIKLDKSNQVIISYSSALREICSYLDKIGSGPIQNNLNCIIAVAESLSDETRISLKKYFNTPVLLRYSNLENGILSLQLSNTNFNLQINSASYFIEILHPDKDEPMCEGEIGRIVVTDLFNYCMPFIRYDTGDLGVITNDDNYFLGAPAFKMVQGRRMDTIYDTKGRIQSTYIIFYLENYPEIKQFQFIQNGEKEYSLILNVEKEFDSEIELIQLFKSYLGEDANIQVNYVNEIPQLSSGKRRLTINNYIV
jgi:phenylacetate-CoA ligase